MRALCARALRAPREVSDNGSMKLQERHQAAADAVGPDGFVHVMKRHVALFYPRANTRLVVSFDNMMSANGPLPHYPWAFNFVEKMGASHLGIMMAAPNDWFRHASLWAFFDLLRDDGFFDQFEEVIFYGSSMGGYGALTFAPAAPGARVVAMVPQTHLDPSVVPFETRYDAGFLRGNWSGPYLDGAEGARSASRVYVLYDPYFTQDAGHVARLDPANTVHLCLPWSTHHAGPVLRRTGEMNAVLHAAFDGTLTRAGFRKTVRAAGRSGMAVRLALRAGLARGHPHLVLRTLETMKQSQPEWSFPRLEAQARAAVKG